MGLFDWIGPTALTKRRGWDHLPAAVPEQKSPWLIDDHRAVIVNTLVHGPGATDLLANRTGNDGNSAVYACLQAIASAYVEAPLTVYKQTSPKEREPQFDSPLQALLDYPNPVLDILELMGWVQWAKHVDGNAYLRKLRAGNPETGNVVELWPISPSRLTPITERGSGDFISYYRYYVRPGVYEDISTDNIVHFRMGINDKDHRLGRSPLKQLIAEISSDEQATRYADRLLSNLAISGLSMEFDKDAPTLTQPQADELKARINAAYSGDNLGATAVLSPGAKLHQMGFSPEQMDLKVLHRVPEERITAVTRVPAIVAGLGAGLDRSTFANYAEANQSFTENTILSLYRADDKKLTHSLARDFTSDRKIIIAHDISEMRALQDDENARATRLKVYVEANILDVDEARAEIGREPRAPEAPAAAAPGGSPPATRSRAPLALLRKSLDDLPGQYELLREAAEGDWEAALLTFLEQQLRRINARLREGNDTADGLVVEGEATLLGDLLVPLQTPVLEAVHGLVVAELGIAFDLDDAATREYLRSAGTNIGGITETTRSAVRAALIEGQAAGEGIPQLAARLRDLPAFSPSRAVTIARTELAMSSNAAALTNYRASGVVTAVTVWDGDYDAECAAMNGRVFPLNNPPALIQHPRCRRALAPVVASQEASA